MLYVRNAKNIDEYKVDSGDKLITHWLKKVKLTNSQENNMLAALSNEYRFFDLACLNYPKKYNFIKASTSATYRLFKHEVKMPFLNRSASGGGYRAGLFIEDKKRVTILFLGHHDDFNKIIKNNDKECFTHLVKTLYPELYSLLNS